MWRVWRVWRRRHPSMAPTNICILFIFMVSSCHAYSVPDERGFGRKVWDWFVGNPPPFPFYTGLAWDWERDTGYNLTDYMHKEHKDRLRLSMDALLKDSKLRLRQLMVVLVDHEPIIAFNYGLVIGKVREKYRNMLDVYREAEDFREERKMYLPPGIRDERVEHFFLHFELIFRYERQIDSMINVLEKVPETELTTNETDVDSYIYEHKWSQNRRRIRRGELDVMSLRAEQELKSKLRERYLMKRLGRPTNMTTPKKRFFKQWPVSSTWDDIFASLHYT
ncbi:uncharacterized protein LOC142974169 [Anticarsia gemmatalis]|uniref:uncharacterized protein LOC142974169 n=1 Tax=Anticarsia gemmatalis TaxID=129554 RepID=UPI003F76C188